MDANHIRQVVAARFKKKLWVVSYEVGLCKHGRLRADVVAVNMGSKITIVEVKSSLADFLADKKMGLYAQFANQLYLACSAEVYAKVKNKVLPGIGVMTVSDGGLIRVVKRAQFREVDAAICLNIITRLAYRAGDTLYARKSTTAGAKFVAHKAVDAILAIPLKQRKGRDFVAREVAKAIETYV